MEIQPSILSQAIYGENGRVALPLNMFMKKYKNTQFGGKTSIENLGVPLVIALVEIHTDKQCHMNNIDTYNRAIANEPIEEYKQYNEYEQYKSDYMPKYEPISDELYDTLLTKVLAEPIKEISPSDSYTKSSKKHTRKIQIH
jgi:hypothetical protein